MTGAQVSGRAGEQPRIGGWASRELTQLRTAAIVLAARGWPVMPGTYCDERGEWRGRPDVAGLRPVAEDWAVAATTSIGRAAEWWTDEPCSVLVCCGFGVDAVELPASAQSRVLGPLRAAGLHPPAMLTPSRTLVMFVRTPQARPAAHPLVSVCSTGTWVAVPPTQGHGPTGSGYRWVPDAAPGEVGWELPEMTAVWDVIVGTVRPVLGRLTPDADNLPHQPPRSTTDDQQPIPGGPFSAVDARWVFRR